MWFNGFLLLDAAEHRRQKSVRTFSAVFFTLGWNFTSIFHSCFSDAGLRLSVVTGPSYQICEDRGGGASALGSFEFANEC